MEGRHGVTVYFIILTCSELLPMDKREVWPISLELSVWRGLDLLVGNSSENLVVFMVAPVAMVNPDCIASSGSRC